ncbi:HK-domain-containing protein [Terfezia boudieri ATCC MYA-4762]|uniref:HK-domain-containing protein n=1 Tax=Terfezia boudieri ATCC MYA-4762 TaxID=1051890 RepID=A0A3N4LSL4_9PEZI|nr:HK-domain-containing protein [Terfezia boudieri ATCC MYA-4762]
MSHRHTLDLSLYLVTSSDLLPSNTTLAKHVEAAIKGGVSIVQLREKNLDTGAFIRLAKEVHGVTKKHSVPLLINDRVDVALAVGCEGVHVGQSDLDYATARVLLGPSAYIGISATNVTEAVKALDDISDVYADPGTTYLGLGPVYATATKPDHKTPIGPEGIREILQSLSTHKLSGARASRPLPDTQFVAIGGINRENLYNVLYMSEPTLEFKEQQKKSVCPRILKLGGVAVVSAIMASPTPQIVARELCNQINTASTPAAADPILSEEHISQSTFDIIKSIPIHMPLIHHITNSVVKGFSANVTLAVGASPIMSENPMEMKDLAAITSGFVLNMGTSLPEFELVATKGITENNRKGNPIVFDPVGAGATKWRRELSHKLVEVGYFDVIKGNRGEILTIAGAENIVMRGVDDASVDGAMQSHDLARVVRDLALRENNIIVMTGKSDIVSNGMSTYIIHNGHPWQAKVTGTGCSLGSVLAAALSVIPKIGPVVRSIDRKLSAVISGMLLYNIAAERAAKRAQGPASWKVAFLDCLSQMVETGFLPEEAKIEKLNLV